MAAWIGAPCRHWHEACRIYTRRLYWHTLYKMSTAILAWRKWQLPRNMLPFDTENIMSLPKWGLKSRNQKLVLEEMLQNKKRRTRQALQNRENEIVLWIGLTASIGGRRLRYNIRILRRLPSHEMTIALLMVFSGFDWWVLLYPDCESVVCSHAPWIIDIRQVSLSSTGWYPVRVRVARWMHGCYPSFQHLFTFAWI